MNYKFIKEQSILFFKKWVYNFLLKRLFGAAVGGVKGIIIKYIFDYAWKRALKPAILWLFRKGQVYYQSKKNNKKLGDLHSAVTEDEWDDKVDKLP